MHVLVTYASKHGSTKGIAERIGETLVAAGVDAVVAPIPDVPDLGAFDAYVVGSAAYMGAWLPEADTFVRHNADALARKPVYLFSSGPIGEPKDDEKRREALVESEPSEFREFEATLKPRDKHVFYGAHDPDAAPVGLAERVMHLTPRQWRAHAAGDFREWPEIDAWARGIARDLVSVPALA